jgi:hypothetical protein
MDINVRLYGGRGGGRQGKVSAKATSKGSKMAMAGANPTVANLKGINKGVSQLGSFMSGSSGALASVFTNVPVVGMIYAGMQAVDKTISFGTRIYQAHSGENMLSSNIRAYSKTGASLGLNIVAGGIQNRLFVAPQINRQNLALDYGREIYNFNAFGEKNKRI